MTTITTAASPGHEKGVRSATRVTLVAFGALVLRDLVVLRKNLKEFLVRTLVQPLLLVFVFTYLLVKMGEITDAEGTFASLLVAGIVVLTIVIQGMQAVAHPLIQELGVTREIEDRVLAPMPVWLLAVEKIVAGAVTALLAALIVFPLAAVIPATPIHLDVNWPVAFTAIPLACILSSAGGLTFATMLKPRNVPLLFSAVVLPLVFLGGIFFTWYMLAPIPWLQYLVLANPVIYMSESIRTGLVYGVYHIDILPMYAGLVGFTCLFCVVGVRRLVRRVRQ